MVQAAEDCPYVDPASTRAGVRGGQRRLQGKAAVGALRVVVVHVLVEHSPQVPLSIPADELARVFAAR